MLFKAFFYFLRSIKDLSSNMEDDLSLLNDHFEDVFGNEIVPFRLFHLPPELWLRICELAVIKKDPIDMTAARDLHNQVKILAQPALTRTCRLLRREALPVFYQYNTFVAYHICRTACPRQWFVAIGADNLRLMGTFEFYALFSPEFWVKKFEEMLVKAAVTKEGELVQSRCKNHKKWFTKLVVKFLSED